MQTFYQSYLDRLKDLHSQISTALESLPGEMLDWSPAPEMNSIDVLITHLAGAERYWIGDVAMGESSDRVREAEFHVKGASASDLQARLDASLAYAQEALEKLDLPDLESTRTNPRDGKPVTVAAALLHPLEHTAIHLGHIQLTRQLWEERQRAADQRTRT